MFPYLCFSCWYRFDEVLQCTFWPLWLAWGNWQPGLRRVEILTWMPSLKSVPLLPLSYGCENWVSERETVLCLKTNQAVGNRARLPSSTRVLFWTDVSFPFSLSSAFSSLSCLPSSVMLTTRLGVSLSCPVTDALSFHHRPQHRSYFLIVGRSSFGDRNAGLF